MNIVEVLASSALFGQLDRNAVAAIADNAQLRYAGLDEVLYQTGETADSLFLIHTADGNAAGPAIQIAFGDGGGSHVGFRLMTGEVAGDVELLLGGLAPKARKRVSAARALAKIQLIEVPFSCLADALENRAFRQRLVRDATKRLTDIALDYAARGSMHPEVGFACGLLELLDDYGQRAGNKGTFPHRLKQQEIADALGMSRRHLSNRLSDWSSRGLLETIPLQLLDIARIERIASLADGASATVLGAAIEDVEELVGRGRLAEASQAAVDMLILLPGNPVFAYLLALVSVRTGAWKQAFEIASMPGFAWDGSMARLKDALREAWSRSLQTRRGPPRDDDADEEIALRNLLEQRLPNLAVDVGALRARLQKDLLFQLDPQGEAFSRHASSAALLYGQVHEASPNHYCAINAATLHLVTGDRAAARRHAEDAKRMAQREGENYWSLASCGEASLVLGKPEEAKAFFVAARAQPDADLAKITSTRRQLRLMREFTDVETEGAWNSIDPGRPVFFSGPLMTPKDGTEEELAAAERVLADRFGEWLAARDIPFAYSAAACGADIIFAEAVIRAGIPLHIVLPFSITRFCELSVKIGSAANWESRYFACLDRAASVTELWRDDAGPTAIDHYFHQGNRHMAGEVIFAAHTILTDPLMLAVIDKRKIANAAGAKHQVNEFQAIGYEVDIIPSPFERRASASGNKTKSPFAPVVFAFSRAQQDNSAVGGLLARAGFATRSLKDRRMAGHLLCDSFGDALNVAAQISRQAAQDGVSVRVVCDCGPVRQRDGSANLDALLKLEAAGDLTAIAVGDVFATNPFVMADLATAGNPARYTAVTLAAGEERAGQSIGLRGSRTIYKFGDH